MSNQGRRGWKLQLLARAARARPPSRASSRASLPGVTSISSPSTATLDRRAIAAGLLTGEISGAQVPGDSSPDHEDNHEGVRHGYWASPAWQVQTPPKITSADDLMDPLGIAAANEVQSIRLTWVRNQPAYVLKRETERWWSRLGTEGRLRHRPNRKSARSIMLSLPFAARRGELRVDKSGAGPRGDAEQ